MGEAGLSPRILVTSSSPLILHDSLTLPCTSFLVGCVDCDNLNLQSLLLSLSSKPERKFAHSTAASQSVSHFKYEAVGVIIRAPTSFPLNRSLSSAELNRFTPSHSTHPSSCICAWIDSVAWRKLYKASAQIVKPFSSLIKAILSHRLCIASSAPPACLHPHPRRSWIQTVTIHSVLHRFMAVESLMVSSQNPVAMDLVNMNQMILSQLSLHLLAHPHARMEEALEDWVTYSAQVATAVVPCHPVAHSDIILSPMVMDFRLTLTPVKAGISSSSLSSNGHHLKCKVVQGLVHSYRLHLAELVHLDHYRSIPHHKIVNELSQNYWHAHIHLVRSVKRKKRHLK